ncbi:endonuclease III [Candidatus Parcubacteria bacterium]|nr:MAG: endonuclease III [Candidatus Parcubacteria bacterium]
MRKLTPIQRKQFQNKVWKFYKENKRDFPWRKSLSTYRIVLSELMLQQTQVSRVEIKFKEFLKTFPNFTSLANAPFRDVLRVWQGMGYNRRAKYLKSSAEIVVQKYNKRLPRDPEILKTLPGIVPNTAGSICAFAFNKPVVFIETNIRSVFIHEFFKNKNNIDDAQLLPLIEQTLDTKNPREWYSALMDYGTWIKQQTTNPNRKSKHHTKQSTFKGSDREIRGKILKSLTQQNNLTQNYIIKKLDENPERVGTILSQLEKEDLIKKNKNRYTIS